MKGIIALLTDFGPLGSHYVASMKGVILKINPEISIIDISHNVTPFSIMESSYLIKGCYKHFPENTVFIIVVDPGVGGNREILAMKTKSKHYFIGPNNGVFSNILKSKNIVECVEVKNVKYFNQPVSDTFHGRDIMAPVGAYITDGIPLNEFGSHFSVNKIISQPIKYEINVEKKRIDCVIQYVDSFGNGITNIPIRNNFVKGTKLFLKHDSTLTLRKEDQSHEGTFVTHFGSVAINDLVFLIGSSGFLEISKNQGNASRDLGFKVGDSIIIIV